MRILTMGYTRKSAREFFERLRDTGVRRLIDVRLNNSSQLAGFTKKGDLPYLLEQINHIPYAHVLELAPTRDMLDAYRKRAGGWDAYERRFLTLLRERRVEQTLARDSLADACLLCSEPTPHHCHRRLVAEYLQQQWRDVEIQHL